MKNTILAVSLAGIVGTGVLAQDAAQVEQLKQQIQTLQRDMERVQRQQREQIEALQKQVELLQQVKAVAPPPPLSPPAGTSADNPPPAQKAPWSPSDPITLVRAGGSYMNISFGSLLDFGYSTDNDVSKRLNLGDHDPKQRGFSMRNSEIALDGAVDPYFKGAANMVMKLERNQETVLELEEAYLQTTDLPGNIQFKAGQFFANFGRQNPQHPHQWQFVDAPLILTRMFGPDGFRNPGAQVSWLTPLPFYTEIFLGVSQGQSSQAFSFRNPGEDDGTGVNRFHGRATIDRGVSRINDLVFTPRIASSFELTDTQTLLVGASGAFGSNDTGPHSTTEIYGVDAFWKWKSATAEKGFPFVTLQAEGIYRRFGAGADPLAPTPLTSENLVDYGFYSQLMWGFKTRWVAGLRGEYVNGSTGQFDALDPFRGERRRISPNITFYPSEFSKIRLQYNYDEGEFITPQHSIWLQLEFQLGAHAPHKF